MAAVFDKLLGGLDDGWVTTDLVRGLDVLCGGERKAGEVEASHGIGPFVVYGVCVNSI